MTTYDCITDPYVHRTILYKLQRLRDQLAEWMRTLDEDSNWLPTVQNWQEAVCEEIRRLEREEDLYVAKLEGRYICPLCNNNEYLEDGTDCPNDCWIPF
jgi:hypothetical protein